jgi:hypothetical protein
VPFLIAQAHKTPSPTASDHLGPGLPRYSTTSSPRRNIENVRVVCNEYGRCRRERVIIGEGRARDVYDYAPFQRRDDDEGARFHAP